MSPSPSQPTAPPGAAADPGTEVSISFDHLPQPYPALLEGPEAVILTERFPKRALEFFTGYREFREELMAMEDSPVPPHVVQYMLKWLRQCCEESRYTLIALPKDHPAWSRELRLAIVMHMANVAQVLNLESALRSSIVDVHMVQALRMFGNGFPTDDVLRSMDNWQHHGVDSALEAFVFHFVHTASRAPNLAVKAFARRFREISPPLYNSWANRINIFRMVHGWRVSVLNPGPLNTEGQWPAGDLEGSVATALDDYPSRGSGSQERGSNEGRKAEFEEGSTTEEWSVTEGSGEGVEGKE